MIEESQDMTDRARFEAQQREQQVYNRSLIEASADALFAIAPDGIITDVNEEATRFTGYSTNRLINSYFAEYFTEPARARAGILQTLEQGRVLVYELTLVTPPGRHIMVNFSAGVYTDAAGGPLGILAATRDITAQKQLEHQLRDQQFYTRSLIESNIDALMTTDPLGIISDVNQQMEALTGSTRKELIGTPFKNYFTDPQRAEAGINLVLQESKVTNYELTACRKDGQETVVSYNATTFYDRDGKLQGVFAAARDITERRRAEADLKAVETFSQNIVDTVREPLLTLDTTLRVHSANRAFYQTFHVSPEETENHLIYELGNGQWDIPALRTLLEEIIPKNSVFSDFELEHTFPVIGRRVMLLNARQLKAGNHGELLVLAMEDVTERRHAEEEVARAAADLKAVETFSQNIVDTVREPLLMLDTTLRVHSANRAFYRTFCVSPKETENRLIYELGNGQWDIPHLRTLLEDVVPKSSVFNDFELEHTFPVIGRRVMLLNARQLKAGNHGELLVLAMEDVTERRHAEEEVAKAKETAEAANKTKSLFLANMSHELRTPLNAILGYSEMLQEEAAEQGLKDFTPDLKRIHSAGKHLLSLINDILDLSKIEAGKMELYLESFDVPKLIEEVIGTIHPLVEANANTLRVQCAGDLGMMRADMTKVRQSLLNLLSNAAKFTKEGVLSLEVSRESMDGREWIWFRVSDTGIGMSAEQIVNLFQAFSQADASTTRKFGGTGLGLALTRRFCQMMGGDVMVKSVQGESSAFTIKIPADVGELDPLPIAVAAEPAAMLIAAQGLKSEIGGDAEALPLPGSSVLVIDDDPIQRDLMRRFLTSEGFVVRTAGSGREGLRLAQVLLPLAITLDVMMPDMDGWIVLSLLKADALLCRIPVIMLTMMDDKKRGYAMGAANYITKPTDRKALAQILKTYRCPNPPCPVLLVDDDATTRAMMRLMLEKAGWAVSEAENGRAALERVRKDRPALILLDLMMPEMDGFEFAAELHRHEAWRSIPIVVLTARELTVEEVMRLNGNVHTILDKGGHSREDLMQQVRSLLAGWAVPAVGNTAG